MPTISTSKSNTLLTCLIFKPLHNQHTRAYNKTRSFFARKYLCHAPFKAIRFGLGGHISVCCLNKADSPGHYPHITIKEAWSSTALTSLRMAFVQNLFPPGCEECASTINRGAYNSVKSRHYDIVHNARGTPAMIEFELQNTCNLKCIMCSAFYSSALMPQELENKHNNIYDMHFVDQLRPYASHLKFASFVGGEPFLIDLYFDIWTLLTQANPNIKININTNGTILNERVKQMLFQGNFDISLSLDSIVPETYAKIRVNATLSKTLENVRFFYNYCKNKGTIFSIWACPMTLNCFEIPDLLTYFNNMQVPVYFNHVQRPDALTLKSLPVDQLKNLSNIYKAFAKQKHSKQCCKREHDPLRRIIDFC
jgi:molybdenum cofactor biosynthesis enzyme MoaA